MEVMFELKLQLHPDYPHINTEYWLDERKTIYNNPCYIAGPEDIYEPFEVYGEINGKDIRRKDKKKQKNKKTS